MSSYVLFYQESGPRSRNFSASAVLSACLSPSGLFVAAVMETSTAENESDGGGEGEGEGECECEGT